MCRKVGDHEILEYQAHRTRNGTTPRPATTLTAVLAPLTDMLNLSAMLTSYN